MQDLGVDLEVVFPHIRLTVLATYHNEEIDPVDLNATSLPMHSTRGINSPVMEFRQLVPSIFHLYSAYYHRQLLVGITQTHNVFKSLANTCSVKSI